MEAQIPSTITRDTAAEILEIIQELEEPMKLYNDEEFAADGLMNEWTYVIDLDQMQLEVYKAFGKGEVPKEERFAIYNGRKTGNEISDKYSPVKLAKIYPLINLPTLEQMQEDCDKDEEEEE